MTSLLIIPSVLVLSKVLRFVISHEVDKKVCQGAWKRFADCAHEPVLQILQSKTAELQYANVRRGKPGLRQKCLVPVYFHRPSKSTEIITTNEFKIMVILQPY